MPAEGIVPSLPLEHGLVRCLNDILRCWQVDVAQVKGVNGVAGGGEGCRIRRDCKGGFCAQQVHPLGELPSHFNLRIQSCL